MYKDLLTLIVVTCLLAGCRRPAAPAPAPSDPVSVFEITAGNDVQALRAVLSDPAQRDQRDALGNTLLHIAAMNQAQDAALELIRNGAPIDSRNQEGETPLIAATRAGDPAMIRTLLRKNASPSQQDAQGHRAITIAADSGRADLVRELALYSRDHLDDALMVASLRGHSTLVPLLTQQGASVYTRLADDGRTPLMLAAQSGHAETVRVLLENGANRYSTNESGTTAAQLATQAGHHQIATYLGAAPAQNEFTPSDLDASMVADTVTQVLSLTDYAAAAQDSAFPPDHVNVASITQNLEVGEISGLTVRAYREDTLPLQVTGVTEQAVKVQYLYGDHTEHEIPIGATIPETDYEVLTITPRYDHSKMTSSGQPEDVSIVEVRNQRSGEILTMTAGLEIFRTAPYALVQEAGSTLFLVAQEGDRFTDTYDREFRVLEVRPGQVVLQDTSSQETFTIKQLF